MFFQEQSSLVKKLKAIPFIVMHIKDWVGHSNGGNNQLKKSTYMSEPRAGRLTPGG